MQTIDISTIPLQEKFLLMEQLWESLSHEANHHNFTPQWHTDELKRREAKIQKGESNFNDLSEVKKRLEAFASSH